MILSDLGKTLISIGNKTKKYRKQSLNVFIRSSYCLFAFIKFIDIKLSWRILQFLRFKDRLGAVTWADIWNAFGECGVRSILLLIDLVLSLPPTSVNNEASFNQMKLIKTDRRQRLSNEHLNDCMLVRLESAEIASYDPTPAVEKWMVITFLACLIVAVCLFVSVVFKVTQYTVLGLLHLGLRVYIILFRSLFLYYKHSWNKM